MYSLAQTSRTIIKCPRPSPEPNPELAFNKKATMLYIVCNIRSDGSLIEVGEESGTFGVFLMGNLAVWDNVFCQIEIEARSGNNARLLEINDFCRHDFEFEGHNINVFGFPTRFSDLTITIRINSCPAVLGRSDAKLLVAMALRDNELETILRARDASQYI